MIHRARTTFAAVLLGCHASAQTAVVTVGHSDPDGMIAPGETIRITAWHARSGESILAGIRGDLLATGDLGAAGNRTSALQTPVPMSHYPFSMGVVQGGSVRGVEFQFTSHPGFIAGFPEPAYGNWTGVELFSFDWTTPAVATATTIDFNWVPSAAYADVYAIVPPYSQFNWAFLPTTYTGASIVVVPAPASAVLFPAAFVFATPRRRHR